MAKKNNQNKGLKGKALVRPVISYKPGKPNKLSKSNNKPTPKPENNSNKILK
jgi:hypothetical protein